MTNSRLKWEVQRIFRDSLYARVQCGAYRTVEQKLQWRWCVEGWAGLIGILSRREDSYEDLTRRELVPLAFFFAVPPGAFGLEN